MMVLKIDHYQTFRNPSPLPWERANRNNLKKTSSEKDGNKKYALPKPPKEKHKQQLLPNTFQTTPPH